MYPVLLAFIYILASPQYDPVESLTIFNKDEVIEEINREQYTIPYFDENMVDSAKLELLARRINTLILTKPQDAWINEQNEIVPAKTGKMLDEKQFLKQLYQFYYEGTVSEIQVPLKHVYPKVDSELLEKIYSKRIGQYTTYFNSKNEERSNNIYISTEAINNQVVFPNEVFSFNHVVGKRTKERGYLPAPVIVKGELAEDVGGGICQVSSTLYNAIDRAGIKVVERYSHSRRVPYVPSGRDATVSWYGPDFTFMNNYNQPVFIKASAKHGQVMISIYSSEIIRTNKNDIPKATDQLPKEIHVNEYGEYKLSH
ncbi:VanW family protein [Aquibacillus koreensis]|uniref:VanW family protein n=1 Tax=Aquibacillus koreensis TaxID=279446 RepID=A0A9X4AJS7_9BACI|nr:VanW family protein [Aquibacillus koreensis]MCT2534225.1 VanW family protein [Aquibacillus koreensis]MDC3420730.1 VanW family protein [Aquibacillus koreensis]